MPARNLHVVLVRPLHPLNIGAAARAMKNMSVNKLRLVNPECNPFDILSLRMAHGAREILSQALIFPTIMESLKDIQLVIATTARKGKDRYPLLMPEEAKTLVQRFISSNRVAILFGNEETGLHNEELKFAHHLLHVPCSEEQGSLNLAQAVLLVLYEITRQDKPATEQPILASAFETSGLFAHMERVYSRIGFLKPGRQKQMMRRIRRIFQKGYLSEDDVKILRGILRNTEWAIQNK